MKSKLQKLNTHSSLFKSDSYDPEGGKNFSEHGELGLAGTEENLDELNILCNFPLKFLGDFPGELGETFPERSANFS